MSHGAIPELGHLSSSVLLFLIVIAAGPVSCCQEWSSPNPGSSDLSEDLAEELSLSSYFHIEVQMTLLLIIK